MYNTLFILSSVHACIGCSPVLAIVNNVAVNIEVHAYFQIVVCLLWKNVCLDLLPIFWIELFVLILSCMNCWYILEINPLLVTLLAHIFSHSILYLFILFLVSFALLKLLSWIRIHLFMFVFIFITLRSGSKKILLWFMSECPACVSSL